MKKTLSTALVLSLIEGTALSYAQVESHQHISSSLPNRANTLLTAGNFFAGQAALGQEKGESRCTTREIIFSIAIGTVFGSMLGAGGGALIGNDNMASGFRGALIGASTFPFMVYEDLCRQKKVSQGTNSWRFRSGAGFTYTNYAEAKTAPGFLFGVSRDYGLGTHTSLRGGIAYEQRKFRLQNQKLLYTSMSGNRIRYENIDFSVGYVSTALMLAYQTPIPKNFVCSFSLGPSISVPVTDKTRYEFLREEDFVAFNPDYDFVFQGEEPGVTWCYPALNMALAFESKNIILETSLKLAAIGTHQIFPLVDRTKLNTLDLMIGYKFKF
jgi:Outer membrane protein beta-barrel domain